MTQDDHIEELVEQVNVHGPSKVLFTLVDGVGKELDSDEVLELDVRDCQYDGTYINVKLGLPA